MTTPARPASAVSLDDFYELDALYDPEERMIRDSVRDFVRSEIVPNVADWWREDAFPADLPRRFGALGMLGVTLPERYGGSEASYTAYGLINRELEYADSGMRSFVSVQSSLVMYPIHRYGSEALRKRWLPLLASGEAVGCFGLTEPDAGSDPGAMRTRVRKVGDEYVLNGVKRWITNGSRGARGRRMGAGRGRPARSSGSPSTPHTTASRRSTSRPRRRCGRR